jgi:hypothetical protein
LPSHIIEPIIALSIPGPSKRTLTTDRLNCGVNTVFGFGLVHGMGFASALTGWLPARDYSWPRLFFNVGVD